MQRFILHKDPDTRATVRRYLDRYLDNLSPGRTWRVEIKQYVRKRSTEANARWWALMTAISQQAPPHMDGQWFDPELWHEHLVRRFAGVEAGPFGDGIRKRTSQMDREQFDELMAEVEAWAYSEFEGFRFDRVPE